MITLLKEKFLCIEIPNLGINFLLNSEWYSLCHDELSKQWRCFEIFINLKKLINFKLKILNDFFSKWCNINAMLIILRVHLPFDCTVYNVLQLTKSLKIKEVSKQTKFKPIKKFSKWMIFLVQCMEASPFLGYHNTLCSMYIQWIRRLISRSLWKHQSIKNIYEFNFFSAWIHTFYA